MRLDPRRYNDYCPLPHRTLSTCRTWRERILDLRHCCGLTRREFSTLSNIEIDLIRTAETKTTAADRVRKRYRPELKFILSVRRMEAIFKEELIRYLDKPHRLLHWREMKRRKLDLYGGYKEGRCHTESFMANRRTVSFGDRSFEDIAQMADVEAIRQLKSVKDPGKPAWLESVEFQHAGRDVYGRILSAASRGHLMSLAEIARVAGHDQEISIGRPVQEG